MGRYNECERQIFQILSTILEAYNPLLSANLFRLLACLKILEKDFETASKIINCISELFNCLECELGIAICYLGKGYLKFRNKEMAAAKARFKHSLKTYTFLDHNYGRLISL